MFLLVPSIAVSSTASCLQMGLLLLPFCSSPACFAAIASVPSLLWGSPGQGCVWSSYHMFYWAILSPFSYCVSLFGIVGTSSEKCSLYGALASYLQIFCLLVDLSEHLFLCPSLNYCFLLGFWSHNKPRIALSQSTNFSSISLFSKLPANLPVE